MEKKQIDMEFVHYEQALELKELGFDEPCFGRYWIKQFQLRSPKNYNAPTEKIDSVSAPLYQQAFRWFREKYKLYSCVFFENDTQYYFQYVDTDNIVTLNTDHKTYEEAELACLNKLIEIVKTKSE